MAETITKPERAWLYELKDDMETIQDGGSKIAVQFNPESLKVSFSNQVVTPDAQGNKDKPPPPRQIFGAGTTKLALQLWFDVSALDPTRKDDSGNAIEDVRKLTEKVAFFMIPQERPYGLVPPAVMFAWGTFTFKGVMDSLEESLEFFSLDGRPLRANLSVAIAQTKIDKFLIGESNKRASYKGKGGASGGGTPQKTPGTEPLAQASAGMSFQAMADLNGVGANWQAAASANGIENPRALTPGQLINFNASAGASASFGGSSTGSSPVSVNFNFNQSASLKKTF